MPYIFSSNGNNYTFKKLDNILINIHESKKRYVLIRETVDGVPKYSWTDTWCLVKINNATLFEYTHTSTQPFNNEWQFELPSGLYLVNTSITCYNTNDFLFNAFDSIEPIVGKGYKVSISMDDLSLLDVPFIDTHNSLVSSSDTKQINWTEWVNESHAISPTTNIPSFVCLGGVKSITIVFEHLSDASSDSS